MTEHEPRWREDFPTDWEPDHYITRRELAKFLTLGSALLSAASAFIAFFGKKIFRVKQDGPRHLIGKVSDFSDRESKLFRYPSEEDPCILVKSKDGNLVAYSQICTHLSCAVVHRPEQGKLLCPCHHGWFDAQTGIPVAGPPTRRLPRIRLEVIDNDVFAVGKEV